MISGKTFVSGIGKLYMVRPLTNSTFFNAVLRILKICKKKFKKSHKAKNFIFFLFVYVFFFSMIWQKKIIWQKKFYRMKNEN